VKGRVDELFPGGANRPRDYLGWPEHPSVCAHHRAHVTQRGLEVFVEKDWGHIMRSGAGGCASTADREQQDRYGCHNEGRSLSTESTLSTPDPLHLQPPPVQHSPPAYRSLNAPHAAAPNPHLCCVAIPLNPADPRACSDQRAGQRSEPHRTATANQPPRLL